MCKKHTADLQHSTHIDSWNSQGKLVASQRLDHVWLQFIVLLHREPHVSVQRELATMVLQNGFGGLVVAAERRLQAAGPRHWQPRQQAGGCSKNKIAAVSHAAGQCIVYLDLH